MIVIFRMDVLSVNYQKNKVECCLSVETPGGNLLELPGGPIDGKVFDWRR